MENRTVWCCRCCASVWSRGEKFFSRRLDWEDLTEDEQETEIVTCDFCDEEFGVDDELYIIQ